MFKSSDKLHKTDVLQRWPNSYVVHTILSSSALIDVLLFYHYWKNFFFVCEFECSEVVQCTFLTGKNLSKIRWYIHTNTFCAFLRWIFHLQRFLHHIFTVEGHSRARVCLDTTKHYHNCCFRHIHRQKTELTAGRIWVFDVIFFFVQFALCNKSFLW